ncbi:MAG: glycoside hydrolase family 2 TIM barrel-domain containing protein [Lachnospiraceae bacterium]|nr:glycoside hydrolase family 2 TIM barrel-domain containing protein [Lachnospiraceae bacterium]
MTKRIAINKDWMFQSDFEQDMIKKSYDSSGMEQIELPHTNKILPYHYFDESEYQMTSGYRKEFEADQSWKGQQVLLVFEAVAHRAEVFLNEKLIGSHDGGYTAFSFDVTDALLYEEKNVLCVKADSREILNIPPFGHVIDYMTYGGIYREVSFLIRPQTRIEELFITTGNEQETEKTLSSQIKLIGTGKVQIRQNLMSENECIKSFTVMAEIPDEGDMTVNMTLADDAMQDKVRLWSPEEPFLYDLVTQLICNDEVVDSRTDRIGFRRIRFEKDGFYLNGSKYKIRGLNRHQSYPLIGYAATKNLQVQDVRILKEELGLNAVRTSHYPQSRHFLDACDEMGLLVVTELPGWQHIGDEEWKQCALGNLSEMILEQRNHPSIILWGVRINESADDDSFYERTNELAHRLDPSRQTGGVRFIKNSHLLEDVYTYNDFSHRGNNPGIEKRAQVTKETECGYLVTEYNGHMFPTKSFDSEERRMEHANRHARVLNDCMAEEGVSGGFGWCMADYNTHQDFGSGDRICYHGVLDMFRNPKPAAYAYSSQSEKGGILVIPSTLNIGEHNAGYLPSFYAYTNADSIRVYKNNQFVKEFYPDRKSFPALPHPPVRIDDFVGELMEKGEGYSYKKAEALKEVLTAVGKYGQADLPLKYKLKMLRLMLFQRITFQDGIRLYNDYFASWGGETTSYRFEAIKNGTIQKTVIKEPVKKVCMEVNGRTTLEGMGETCDMELIRIRMTDENNQVLPFYQEPLSVTANGGIELVGPNLISLKGGMGGVIIKTVCSKGEGALIIKGEQIPETVISFQIQ